MSTDFQQESQNSLQTAMTTSVKETDAAEQVVEAKTAAPKYDGNF